jgi:hypothetical protein
MIVGLIVKKDCIRIENLLYNNAKMVNKACKKATGRKKEKLESNLYKLSMQHN